MPNTGEGKPPPSEITGTTRVPDQGALAEAGVILRAGGLVAFPTETVYGLGADATNGEAVARIFAAKGRPAFNPLIVHVANLDAATAFGLFNDDARRLAKAFWPGPLTLVVPRAAGTAISELVSAGLPTLALRCPQHAIAQALLAAAGRPLAAPSANRSGHVSATEAKHVADDLGARVAMILDGGATMHGLESTVVDMTEDHAVLLRPGAVSVAELEGVLGKRVQRFTGSTAAPHSPGQLESHYAPNAKLRLNATSVAEHEALLAFGPDVPRSTGAVINLSPRGDMIEAAAKLFAALRTLDTSGAHAIAVMPIPGDGLGEAINDRLKRAAAPRP